MLSRIDLDFKLTLSIEWQRTIIDEAVEDDTEGPNVSGSRQVAFLLDNMALWCCEARCSFTVKQMGVCSELASTTSEIGQFTFCSRATEQDVVRLDISMDHV